MVAGSHQELLIPTGRSSEIVTIGCALEVVMEGDNAR